MVGRGFGRGGGSLTIFIVYLQASLIANDGFWLQDPERLRRASALRRDRSPLPLRLCLYTTLLYTQTPRVNIVSAVHRQCARSYRAQALLALLHVTVRIDPGVLGVKHRRGRWVIEVLEIPEVFRPLGLVARVARLEDVRPFLELARYHVRIVVRQFRVYLLLQVVPPSLVRRRGCRRRRRRRRRRRQQHGRPMVLVVLFALVLHQLRLHLGRLRRVVATVERQRYPDDQNANGGYTAGEASHQEAIIGRLVGDPATWRNKRKT